MMEVLDNYGIESASELDVILSRYFEHERSIEILERQNVSADELDEILSKYYNYKDIIESIEDSLVNGYNNETYDLSDVPYLLEEYFRIENYLSNTDIGNVLSLYEDVQNLYHEYVVDIKTLLKILPNNKHCDFIRYMFNEIWPVEFTLMIDNTGIEIYPSNILNTKMKLEAIKRLIEIVIDNTL